MEGEYRQEKDIHHIVGEFNIAASSYHRKIFEEKYLHTDPRFRCFTDEMEEGVAGFLGLPESDSERNQLIDRYRKHPDADWGDIALAAMSEYLRHRTEIRFAFGKDWRNCFDDAAGVQALSEKSLSLLDDLIDLTALPKDGNGHERLMSLVNGGALKGLITTEERLQLLIDIAQAESAAAAEYNQKQEHAMLAAATAAVTEADAERVREEKGDVEPEETYDDSPEPPTAGFMKPSGLSYRFIGTNAQKERITKRPHHHNRWTDEGHKIHEEEKKQKYPKDNTPEKRRKKEEKAELGAHVHYVWDDYPMPKNMRDLYYDPDYDPDYDLEHIDLETDEGPGAYFVGERYDYEHFNANGTPIRDMPAFSHPGGVSDDYADEQEKRRPMTGTKGIRDLPREERVKAWKLKNFGRNYP